jgi:hypothetical protein
MLCSKRQQKFIRKHNLKNDNLRANNNQVESHKTAENGNIEKHEGKERLTVVVNSILS